MKKNKNKSEFSKMPVGQKVLFSFVLVLFCIYAVSLIFPLLWLVMSSLKDPISYSLDLITNKPFALPKTWEFTNYIDVFSKLQWKGTNFAGMFFNTLWQITLANAPALICSTLLGYVMAKYEFKMKGFIQTFYVTVLTLPIVGTGGAYFVMIHDMGLYDTPLYPLLTNVYFFTGNYLYMYSCFKNVSWSYAEAVFIDGGGHYTAFFRIMLPQALPILGTLFLTMSIAKWNEYAGVLMYMPSYPTIGSGIYQIQQSISNDGVTLYYTALVVALIPILVLYIIFADKLIKNLTVGGLKG